MDRRDEAPPSVDEVLEAASKLQDLLSDAVLVGGTAAAIHAAHRVSLDADHVLTDLEHRFDIVLEALESTDGWATARVTRPVLILGALDGIETGIRQLRRRRPLEVEEVFIAGRKLRIPTLEEMVRIKAWLVLRRNTVRDHIDLVALADVLGGAAAHTVLDIDDYYEDQLGPTGRRVASQLARQLAQPAPYDLSEVDLRRYRELAPRWRDWTTIATACRILATDMLDLIARADES